MKNNNPPQAPLSALIIGAGFAGIGLAIRLDKAGISDFLILEKAGDVGGTWRDNSYPGAACDVPSHLYSFSFEPKADWTSKYAPQAEILAYIRHCAKKYHLGPRTRFSCEVSQAEFDETLGLWQVATTEGEVLVARSLISACGQLNRPLYPAIPGVEDFGGEAFHSAHWRHDLDLANKRVAVIGTGASAIQFVPQIAPRVGHLTLFQRSAAYVIPKADRPYSAREHALLQRFPAMQKLSRAWQYLSHESRALAFISFPSLMKTLEGNFHKHLESGLSDAVKRRQLVPDYPMGCKRMLISNDFFPSLDRDNVDLVTQGIEAVTAHGVRTVDGVLHEADVLIYGTGFAATDFLAPMSIKGRNGQELNHAWQSGAQAYKGISVSGFPNLFLLYGPNTNLGHNSIIYMLESQFNYVVSCLHSLRQRGWRYIDVKADVQTRFNTRIQQAVSTTVWSKGCTSWYQTAEGKHTNNWPGYTFSYRRLTRTPEFEDYECAR
ncbi:MAG TPA: NAD(P)/FAD-dependent oxidoreductase [Pseudomonas xinjiangensis]|uniref:NAD(P)/FAD-dependent oxidoreductase n=2 Tax=root TaxID=1 RepID=A0A7V1BQS6_9GAMM|nr:NAD(P)/FAD-dependent oxidoreductase [Halopseudomonas xinjiangensis]HEC47340.1 NAD(P)/FAD-dependent oxidoreductase [Halopseudomonas xinjiangensis]